MKPELIVGTIIVVAMLFALGMFSLSNIQKIQANNSMEYNVTGQGITAFSKFSTMLPIIIVIFVAIFIIWIIMILVKSSKSSNSAI
jgi:amino acid transporter